MKIFTIIAVLLCILAGCAPQFNYSTLQNSMASGNCPGSLELMKNSKLTYGDKAVILHMLDSGMINFQCDNPKDAVVFFQDADSLAQELWTKSLTKEAASYVTNDFILPYRGEDFERAMISLFSAFSYIKLGEYDEAMADCRRLDTILTEYNSKYEKKNVYKEDALGRYLSGILSEADKDYSEAYIFYYESFKAFKNYNQAYGTVTPKYLFEDLRRVADPADRENEVKSIVPNPSRMKYVDHQTAKKLGKIILIHLNGKAPVKTENKFTVVTATGPISIAFPDFVATPPSCRSSRLILKSNQNTYTEDSVLFEDINSIALKDLADRKVRITAKTIARAVAKQVVVQASAHEMEKQYGPMAGLMANIAGNVAASALEKADTRSWRTLPGEIYIARCFVPAGQYEVAVENCNGGQKTLEPVTVKAGETKIVFYDTIY